MKRKSSECHPNSSKPKKFGAQASGKICANIIPASTRTICTAFHIQGATLTRACYCDPITNHLRSGIRSKDADCSIHHDNIRPHAAHVASKRMKVTHLRCLILNTCLNSLVMTMILLGHSWKFLVDSVSSLMQKYISWCMSGYAHSQMNFFFIRNTGINKVLGPHNTMCYVVI